MHKILKIFLGIFIIILPWQTRWIFFDAKLDGQIWEYGRLGLYASMIILLVALVLSFFGHKDKFVWLKNKWLYIFLFYLVLISIFSKWPLVSFYYLALMVLASVFGYLSKKVSRDFLLLAWVASGTVQAGLAIWQFFSQKIIANKWLGLAGHLPKDAGTSVIQIGDQRWLRAYGALPHPNILAGFLVLTLIASIFWWQKVYQASEDHEWSKEFIKKSWWHLAILVVALVLQTLALVLTFSRGALLALVVWLLLNLVYSLRKKQILLKQIVIKYFVLLLLLLVLVNTFLPNAWLNRIESNGRLETISTSQRWQSLQQIKWSDPKELLFGQGLGLNSYLAWQQSSEKHKMPYDFQPIHNIYLLILAEIGLFGVLLLAFLLWRFYRKKNKPDFFSLGLLIAILVLGLFDHYLWTSWVGLCLLVFATTNFSKE